MSGSSNVGGSRPILPAPSPHQDKRGSWDKGGATATQKQKNVPKRTQITAVACQPCQQRKSKCDGARPICSACIAKKRMDCAYDTAGDQRRTAALKQRIKELEKQIHDVKEMVRTICSAVDKNVAISIAQTLHMEDFRNVEEVRNLLKSQKSKEMAGLPENFGVQSQIVGEPPGVLVGSHPQSDQVMPSQYDPALINGLSVFEHMSSSWVPGVSGLPSADGTAVDAQWHYDHSPVDVRFFLYCLKRPSNLKACSKTL
ncbi:hypothetical protein K432DRAFT_189280 [Lepidopterella palustris CBS 459.81]|uniref:Zn(2)-C6 fungal-type domain-containing protein n=1 Tax=Lepidopterella palustris CBS 459.81 TaxID=1314670 RepID=A0A8E2EFU4_9PEZI|nr:hypothetical protein K432DRAFT_189280 [Lepidopterella palustris CBS 459.81]